jgi:iron complex outermembrane receptor protein
MKLTLAACALAGFCGLPRAHAEPIESEVVVTATRVEQSSFDLPVSIDSVGQRAIRDGQQQVNLSEALVRVPGVVALNRQNYAQDLQISVRGFGARSTFGVRGVRLYSDGVPATMPDGQGQLSHFDLSSAARIEVLRGPFSALYGNSSGGVIAMFTEDGKPGTALESSVGFGSFGTRRAALKVSGANDAVNYVVSGNDFRTDGYRQHSAARRDNLNAKLRFTLDAASQLTLLLNAVDLPEAQDPLGLSRSQFKADPRQVDARALQFNTRKSVRQTQAGLTYQRQLGDDDVVQAMLYRGHREILQYLSIPAGAQIPATSAGAVIDLGRDYWGTDLNWTGHASLAGSPLQVTLGASYDNLGEARTGYENFIGDALGVRGAQRRDENNTVYNLDQYLQAQWQPGSHWLLAAGVRHSIIRVQSNDHYITAGNGDDSGSTHYSATTPVLGITYKINAALNVYAAYGEGFETPTLNELAYRSTSSAATGLNFALRPSRSKHYEAGVKARLDAHTRLDVAVFHVDTRDELAVLANASGRSVYQNVGRTRRSGLEASLHSEWRNGIGLELAYTLMRATYAEAFSSCPGSPCVPATIAAGNRLPGVPVSALYGELSWRHAPSGFSTALEVHSQAQMYVDDANSDAAPRYTVVNARAGFEQKLGAWQLQEFARVENIGDRRYAGSVIVNDSNGRYFEPAPGRNTYVGVSANYAW